MDETAALRPLVEAADDIRRLDDHDTTRDLAAAITAVVNAIERSLRLRLREDPAAPEAHRINALSREHLPLDDVVRSLRTRDLISLEAAGTVHAARAAADRAEAGPLRPADAGVVRAAVERLREELGAPQPGDSSGDPAEDPAGVSTGGPDGSSGGPAGTPSGAGGAAAGAGGAGGAGSGEEPPRVESVDTRWMRWIAAAFAAAILVGAAWVAVRGGGEEYDDALAAFRAGRPDSAAAGFERVLEDRPRDVTVMLYLARSYRRLERPAEAAEVLRRALETESEDGDVRRELGHLFMDLDRPTSAVAQYERALEYEPENPLNWAALIRALRTLEDPRAERLLRDAPAEVQAALSGA